MANANYYFDQLFFIILPYTALFTFFLVTIQRYLRQTFSYSSLSSQFLENRDHFWGMVPFHYGILVILAGHVAAFLIPGKVLLWNRLPLRLYVLETAALVFAILTLVGLVILIIRRSKYSKIKEITNRYDWILYILMVLQVLGGIYVAIFHRWGSSWFAASLTPYLWSLLKLNPDISHIIGMPLMVKFHIINAFIMIGFFPFTRLVHVLVVPNPYLWRRIQVVRWYRDRSRKHTSA